MTFAISTEGMRQFQLKMVDTIVCSGGPKHSIILPYGSGKTWVSLAAVCRIREAIQKELSDDEFGCLAVVFCRKHNIETWRDECYLRGLTDVVSWDELKERNRLSTRKGKKPLPPRKIDDHTVLLVTHPQIAPEQTGLLRWLYEHRPFALIMDESTKIKVPSTQRTKAALMLAEKHRGIQLTLTGKMSPEGAHECWAQIQFARPHSNPLGSSYYSHLRNWFVQSDRGYALKVNLIDQFKRKAGEAIARMDQEMWDQYTATIGVTSSYVTEYFDESEMQLELVENLFEHWSLPVNESTSDTPPDLDDPMVSEGMERYSYTGSLHSKAQQIANGFYYTGSDGEGVQRLRLNPKLDRLVDILRGLNDEGRQAIIWVHFREDYDIVKTGIDDHGLSCVIGPDAPSLDAFKSGRARFIIMPITISEGFNELAVASTAVYYTNVAGQEARSQAEARMVRLNQKSPIVTHIDLIGRRSYDKHIVELLRNKTFSPSLLASIMAKHHAQMKKRIA